jgi:hypothetical protein
VLLKFPLILVSVLVSKAAVVPNNVSTDRSANAAISRKPLSDLTVQAIVYFLTRLGKRIRNSKRTVYAQALTAFVYSCSLFFDTTCPEFT